MELEHSLRSIEQQYKRATNLDRYQRKSSREEKRLIEQKEAKTQALRTNISANTDKVQRQQMSQPQVQPRRQEVQQQALVKPALIEGAKKIYSYCTFVTIVDRVCDKV